jgi:hypothetical protein
MGCTRLTQTFSPMPTIPAKSMLTVDPGVVVMALEQGFIIPSLDIFDPAHADGCCGCLILENGAIVCNECRFGFGKMPVEP